MRSHLLLATAFLAVAGGLPGVSRAAESLALGGDVESLLGYAREHHPEFAALRAEADAAAARVAPAAALPDPMFGVELRDFTNEARNGSANLLPARVGATRYTLTQNLPWFGKRELRRDIAAAGADAAHGQASAGWVDLAWAIKQTYALHHLQTASLRYGRENLELLGQLERIAQARYANGLAPQQDVIRAQTERTALQGELAQRAGDDDQLAARLRSLLGQPANLRLLPPERLRPLPSAARLDPAALEASLVARNPRLAAESARIAAAEKSRELAYKERYPDVNVGVAAMQQGNRVASYDLMFEINIPLQRDRRRAQEREAERMLDAAKHRNAAALNQVRADLAESLAGLRAAERIEELASGSLLPQAELTLQAALAGYETGKVDFAAVLDAQRQIRKAKEDLVKARATQRMRLADIERAIGEDL
jgi:outer membrane protein TolC